MRREPEVPEESPSGRMSRLPCKENLKKELAPIHSVKSGTLQNASSTRRRAVADLVESARMRIVRLMNNKVKGPKKNDDKSAVALLMKEGKSKVPAKQRGSWPKVC